MVDLEQHEVTHRNLLALVDNAGARASLAHLWEVIKEVAAASAPVVEAVDPAAGAVVAEVEQTAADIGKEIARLQALYDAKRAKEAATS